MQKIFYQSMLQHQKNATLDSKIGSSCLNRNAAWMKTKMTNDSIFQVSKPGITCTTFSG
jgi:hypothetical protein